MGNAQRVTKAQLQDEVERLRLNADRMEAEMCALRASHSALLEERGHLAAEVRAGHSACRGYESRIAEMGMLIEHWAGLPQATWANTESDEFMRLAREGIATQAAGRAPSTASHAALPSVRVNRAANAKRVIYEFDPDVEGSYAQAMHLARENNGIVRRANKEVAP